METIENVIYTRLKPTNKKNQSKLFNWESKESNFKQKKT